MSFRIVALAATLLTPPLFGFQIRSYNSTVHDRFTGTMAAPVKNPNQLYASLDLTGIGWLANAPDLEFALVSRQHIVTATHVASFENSIRFLSSSGQLVNRTASTKTTIMDGGNPTDLTLIKLNLPIDTDAGVEPLPYLDLATSALYVGKTIGVAGQGPVTNGIQVIGRDTLFAVESVPRNVDYQGSIGVQTTLYSEFDYLVPSGTADEGFFEQGDSGSPTFVETNGRPALIGTHSYYLFVDAPGPNDSYQQYDVFVPHYITQLDALMAPLGYRMRPVNAPATTLSGSTSTVETTPRRLKPLTLQFGLTNTGANLTGNLEVEFEFPAGQEPDSVSATGWVTYGAGTKWTLRKATLAAAGAETLDATWAEAPALASLTPTLVWRSDTVADQNSSPVIALAPSYTEWATGLSSPGENDDPDEDGLVNLIEYAFGGDATSGALQNANGGPLLAQLSNDGGTVNLAFPERDDAAQRGLSYTVWYSTDLTTWTTTPPAGVSSGTAPYAPALPGFVERTVTWPDTAPTRFVRVEIGLDE